MTFQAFAGQLSFAHRPTKRQQQPKKYQQWLSHHAEVGAELLAAEEEDLEDVAAHLLAVAGAEALVVDAEAVVAEELVAVVAVLLGVEAAEELVAERRVARRF